MLSGRPETIWNQEPFIAKLAMRFRNMDKDKGRKNRLAGESSHRSLQRAGDL